MGHCPTKIYDQFLKLAYWLYLFSIGAVLDHIADILSSPSLSTADDLKTLPQDYQDFEKNSKKLLSHAQNADSKFTSFEVSRPSFNQLLTPATYMYIVIIIKGAGLAQW